MSLLLLLPATISLLVKFLVLWFSLNTIALRKPSIFIGLVFVSALHNVIEIVILSQFLAGFTSVIAVKFYYVIASALVAYFAAFAIDICRIRANALYLGIVVIWGVLSLLVLFTDSVVAGVTSIGYSVTAVRGGSYWTFQLFALAMLLGTVLFLIAGYSLADSALSKRRAKYALIALSPPMLVGFSVIVLMLAGVQINATMVLPLSVTLFIIIILLTEPRHNLEDLPRFLPFSAERKVLMIVQRVLSDYALGNLSYKDATTEFQRVLVQYKHEQLGGNVAKTAAEIDMPKSSLYRLLKKMDIKTQGKQDE